MSKWEWKKLGDLYPIVMGKTPPRGDPSCWDKSKRTNNVWVTIADISSNENQVITESKEYISDKATKNISLVSPKSLLLSFKLSIGKMAFAGVPLYTNEAIVNFPPIKDIDLHYLHKYFLYYNWDKASEGDTKVKGKTLNKEKLKNIDIPIPPLSEQKRIVKFLDEEFSKIDTLKTNAETNLKNAKELFETTLEKELNPLSRHSERSEESSADLPSGWELKALGDVCYRIKRGKAPKYVEQSDVLVFAQKCNQPDGTMSLEKALCLDPSILGKYKAEDYVKEGDVLVNSTGNGTVGRVGFFNNKLLNNKKPVVPDTHITTIRGLANTFPKYLYYFLKPKESYLSDKSLGTTNMKELHADVLEHLQIPLPPLSVQKEIVARLDKLSEDVKRLEANYKQIIANCDELKKSILKKTFQNEN
ncbi:restriction endonuclease subunit S [Fibrobacter sp.]|uniref:restriction endonuclease subunit S n=1 Tax=Fibrobacter sp. TaxID=35828 RepID=UPI0025C6F60A|nr:restriction endonuclease subunit S [Fibrobacter sp.]MBR3073587.1 restriction endonuclease subunit S [Fibrobacter sp.]